MGDPEPGEFAIGQILAGSVGVVGDQHLIAGLEERQPHVGNGRQATGHQHTLQTALQRTQALFEDEGRGRAVQPVGVAAFVFPLARAHGRNAGKDDGGGLENPRLGSYKPGRRLVVVVDDMGGKINVVVFHASHGSAPPGVTRTALRSLGDHTAGLGMHAPQALQVGINQPLRPAGCSPRSRHSRPWRWSRRGHGPPWRVRARSA